jgi:hypothetical protein
MRKPAVVGKPFDVLLAEPKFFELHAPFCGNDSGAQVIEHVVEGGRPGSPRAEAIEDP